MSSDEKALPHMESEAIVNGDSNRRSSETNWTVVRGTLVNSITWESSLDNNDDDAIKSTAKRSPLILKPTAPNSNPCEITITFRQKHELRQIYVKSTARVYEIYCQSNLQSEREYVWTVKCGDAARDDNDEVLSTNSNESHDNPSNDNLGSESNRTGSEDEWVNIKAPDSSLVLIKPEYYEATAQISDVDPCLSVTLRLLSVQTKDCIIVDEVYVFADPVDTTELENQAGHHENLNGSSLMTMLLPSLLQMSRAKNSTGTPDKPTSETTKKTNLERISSDASFSSLSDVAAKVQNDGNTSTEKLDFQGVNMAGANTTVLESPPQVSAAECKVDDFPTNDCVERSLDQINSRIGRIEDLFLRLEENLLKPINSIDARLSRVEQQLEVLANKQKNTEHPSYTRFCAPNFSSISSDSNSCYHSETDSNARIFHPDVQINQSRGVDDSASTTQLVPGLIVRAPEFSNDDRENEEENQAPDVGAPYSVHQPKRALTVEDALASALAGLMIQAENRTPAFSIKAPEFPNDEDSEANDKNSPRGQQDVGTGPSESGSDSLSNEPNPSLGSSLSGLMTQEENYARAFSIKAPEFSNDKDVEANPKDLPRDQLDAGANGTESDNGSLSSESNPSMDCENDAANSVDNDHLEKSAEEVDENSTSDRPIDKNEDTVNSEEVSSTANQEDASSSTDSNTAVELLKGGSEDKKRNVLLEILESSYPAPSVVDFELPLLDVKFISQDNRESNFSLEALLSDLPESRSEEVIGMEESHDTAPNDNVNSDLILVEDSEPVGPVISSQVYLDFNYCTLQEPLNREDETALASDIPCSHGTFPATLI